MKTFNGRTVSYELVYRWFPRRLHELRSDGFYHPCERRRGILVKSVSMGKTMYLKPEDYLTYNCNIS